MSLSTDPPSHSGETYEAQGPITLPGSADLVRRALGLVQEGRRAILGIAGSPGSGKSSLAHHLSQALRAEAGEGFVASVPMDGFHLAQAELLRLGRADRKGAPDTFDAAGFTALLRRVLADDGDTVYAPSFDRTLEEPVAGSIAVPASVRLVVTEGNYLLLPEPPWGAVRPLLAEAWYCDADEHRRLDQLVRRHVRYGKSEDDAFTWATRSDQANADLVRATRDLADLVLPDEVLRTLTAPAPS